MPSPEFYTIINTAIIGGLLIIGLIWIAEVRAYHRGRLRGMAEKTQRKHQAFMDSLN